MATNFTFDELLDHIPTKFCQAILNCLCIDTTNKSFLLNLNYIDENMLNYKNLDLMISKLFNLSCSSVICNKYTKITDLYHDIKLYDKAHQPTLNNNSAEYSTSHPPSKLLNLDGLGLLGSKSKNVSNSKPEQRQIKKGALFHSIFIAHRIDLATKEIQAILLQAIKMKHIQIDGILHRLPSNQLIICTFSDTQLDINHHISRTFSISCLSSIVADKNFIPEINQTVTQLKSNIRSSSTKGGLLKWQLLQAKYQDIYLSEWMNQYIQDIIVTIRHHNNVLIGPSYYAIENFYKLSKMHALFSGVDFVRPIDVTNIAIEALEHHIVLKHESNGAYYYHSTMYNEENKQKIRQIIINIISHIKPNKD